jgi:beta-phosphoglucomutase-like phosphatase (HAD superfamily)
MTNSKLGLPRTIRACLFDLDGVITETARLHARAWKQTFDELLSDAAQSIKESYVLFDIARNFELYVDRKPREDGTRFLRASRMRLLGLRLGAPVNSGLWSASIALAKLTRCAVTAPTSSSSIFRTY